MIIYGTDSGGGRGGAGGGNCPRAPGQGGRLLRPINKRLGLLNKGKTMIPRLQSVNTANTAIGYLHSQQRRI